MTENPRTLTLLLAETASLNCQLLQLQIDTLENELIACIEPLNAILNSRPGPSNTDQDFDPGSIHYKLARLNQLKLELNQSNALYQAAA
jgi:hypothetical protein